MSSYSNTLQALVVVAFLRQCLSHPLSCRDPPKSTLHAQWAEWTATKTDVNHESLFLLQEHRNTIQKSQFSSQSFELDRPWDKVCAPSDDVNDGVSRRSACAWYHVLNSSPDRYPAVLMEAHRPRNCGGCLHGGTCEPLTFPVAVLEKTHRCDESGHFIYEGAWHDLIVGYACVAAPEVTPH